MDPQRIPRTKAFLKPALALLAIGLVAAVLLAYGYVGVHRAGHAQAASQLLVSGILLVLAALPICGWRLVRHPVAQHVPNFSTIQEL